jgi:ParB family transcriptional regulator, chromosome partitioning protein
MTMVRVSDVRVEGRHRRDLGDIESLMESLREIGQLQPIVVTPDLKLVAGGRRLAAARSLGWGEIEAKVAFDLRAAEALLRAERDENTCRKSFAPTEEHSLYEALLELQAPASADSSSPHSAPSSRDRQSVAEIVTGNAGRHKTLEKIGEVKRIAEDDNYSDKLRQKARDALSEMDLTGNISGPHTRINLALKAELARQNSDMSAWSQDEKELLEQLHAGNTIVVSFREHHANLVRRAEAEGYLVPIDRRTEWGNPFEMPYDGDRQAVIQNYANHYLPHKPSLLSRLAELRGKALACWCAPDPCHGDILKEKAENDP